MFRVTAARSRLDAPHSARKKTQGICSGGIQTAIGECRVTDGVRRGGRRYDGCNNPVNGCPVPLCGTGRYTFKFNGEFKGNDNGTRPAEAGWPLQIQRQRRPA